MKKILLTLIVSVLALSNSFAQDGLFSKMVYGPRVALGTSSMMANHDKPFQDVRFAYSVGAFAECKITDLFSIRPEINYTTRGGNETMEVMGVKTTSDYGIRYIEIPVLAEFNFGQIGLVVGPYMGMKLSETLKVDDKKIDIPENAVKAAGFDAGFSVGASYQLNQTMGLDLRVNHGLMKVFENSDTRNVSILVGFSYYFN